VGKYGIDPRRFRSKITDKNQELSR
jgi:hypothetical protein